MPRFPVLLSPTMPFVGRTYTCTVSALNEAGQVLESTVLTLVDDSPTRLAVDWGSPNHAQVDITSYPTEVKSAEFSCVGIAFIPGSSSPDGAVGQTYAVTEPIPWYDYHRNTSAVWTMRVPAPPAHRYDCTLTLFDDVDPTSETANVVARFNEQKELWGLIF